MLAKHIDGFYDYCGIAVVPIISIRTILISSTNRGSLPTTPLG